MRNTALTGTKHQGLPVLAALALTAASLLHLGDAQADAGHSHSLPEPEWPFTPQVISRAQQNLGAAAQFGQWSDVESWPVVAIHTNLLPNGKVLAWDATPDDSDDDPHTTSSYTTRVSLYDPLTSLHIETNNDTDSDLFCAGSAHLWDGRILFAGGDSGTSGDNGPLENTNIYDYRSNTWRRVTNMATPRWYASVAALASGEMLTFAGAYSPSPLAEVFQFNETWRPLSIETPYPFPEFYQWLQATPEGTVLSFGPQNTIATIDPAADGLWTTGPQRDEQDVRVYGSYAMYDVGKILVSGGGDYKESTDSAVVIDTATQQTTTTGSMNHPRTQHDLTILADGSVLAIGGNDDGTYLYSETGGVYTPEIWSPDSGQWRVMNDMQVDRQYHSTALLLPDGRVLSAGGGVCGDCNRAGYREQNAEIFSPPYLFSDGDTPAVRPVLGDAPGVLDYSEAFTVAVSQGPQLEKLHLIKLGAATHSQNQDQRLVPLSFSMQGNQVQARAPRNRHIAPPGHYMLIAVNTAGVPSVASMVLIGQPLLRSGDVVVNSLAPQVGDGGESDEFVLTSADSDGALRVFVNATSASVKLSIQSAQSRAVDGKPECEVTASPGTQAQCDQPNRKATRWYLTVSGSEATDYTIEPRLVRASAQAGNFSLQTGSTLADRVELDQWNYYQVTAADNQTDLVVKLTNLQADVDLYLQQNDRPGGTVDAGGEFACASYQSATSVEQCSVSVSPGSTWVIGVYGFRAGSYSLTTGSDSTVPQIAAIGSAPVGINVSLNQWQYFSLDTQASTTTLTAALDNPGADLDLYVRRGVAPVRTAEQWGDYDCASVSGAQEAENCTVQNNAATRWIIGVYGRRAGSAQLSVAEQTATASPLQGISRRLSKSEVLALKNQSAGGTVAVQTQADGADGEATPGDTATDPGTDPNTEPNTNPGTNPVQGDGVPPTEPQSPPGGEQVAGNTITTSGGGLSPLAILLLLLMPLLSRWFTLDWITHENTGPQR